MQDKSTEAAPGTAHRPSPVTETEVDKAVALLESLTKDAMTLEGLPAAKRTALLKAAGLLSRPTKEEIRQRNKARRLLRRQLILKQDRSARAFTGIRQARQAKVFQAPAQIASGATEHVLNTPRNCYVCKQEFTRLHSFYDSMCVECGDFNYQKRFQSAPLHGRTAVITGARLKIGYQASLMMLRAGARVIATTRFPVDAAQRYAREEDFAQWKDRIQVYGLDLRHTPSVEIFARYLEQTEERLDILINNAAQTVRRPPGFYAHMLEGETKPFHELPAPVREILKGREECRAQLAALCAGAEATPNTAPLVAWHGQGPGIGLRASAMLSQIPYTYDASLSVEEVFPKGELDADLQQVDLRSMNSWRLNIADVAVPEMLEVQLVNSVAPFVLISKLAPLMRRDNTGQKHVVNVTAMEGKFTRYTKTSCHPHTNMAKAALNMMTLTSSKDLVKDGIYMNAVDTGWVTDEDPAALSLAKQNMHDFHPPLDIVDGAARICDPFFDGINTGTHWNGKFLKDYKPTEW